MIGVQTVRAHATGPHQGTRFVVSLLGWGLNGWNSGTAHPPLGSVVVYLRRNLRAPNLPRKIEYTAMIAPAQLGKAAVKR